MKRAKGDLLWQPVLLAEGKPGSTPDDRKKMDDTKKKTTPNSPPGPLTAAPRAPSSHAPVYSETPKATPSKEGSSSMRSGASSPSVKFVKPKMGGSRSRRLHGRTAPALGFPEPSMPPPPPPVGSSGRDRKRLESAPHFAIPNRKCSAETPWIKLEDDTKNAASLPQGYRMTKGREKGAPAFIPKAPRPYVGKAARDVSRVLTGITQHIYNEPSRGLYFCKKHMAVVTPRLLKIEDSVKDIEAQVSSCMDDVEAGEVLVKSITDIGPKAFERMSRTLTKLVKMLQDERPEENESKDRTRRRVHSTAMARHLHG
uniref:Uncharacterized protein n=1 Tax=Lotharella oceanica TaxID=641309 RepID=A0A7S2TG04_9EUKA|mmetsp:Transcript_12428/g.23792  ORF Transcript_12428/g.23792 Transcript_12428/m.23792 type:complete len:313 (+) Transcript_12428:67-1005(+)|eukprot:CAMPEP_0170199864 /NCGR_PEP_ID=MMETSP0040_2-20121228/69570_1 /TAXON_ID=641309 /ORGANISM="Lotharella oceanica, Strain CCMP622" /LENGTH=312 /DNA_ID=CAMNT_0010450019 /DNA_START=20 /DNA_END=961 /DNA_ORIENTATION=-